MVQNIIRLLARACPQEMSKKLNEAPTLVPLHGCQKKCLCAWPASLDTYLAGRSECFPKEPHCSLLLVSLRMSLQSLGLYPGRMKSKDTRHSPRAVLPPCRLVLTRWWIAGECAFTSLGGSRWYLCSSARSRCCFQEATTFPAPFFPVFHTRPLVHLG